MLTLLIGIHDHQPVGNFGEVIERAYRQAYRPFLDTVERHPSIRLALHGSGSLYEWLQGRHPDYLDRVRALAGEGRLELMGGGFYEPVLAALPEKDQQGQILRMRRYLQERFGVQAKGLWLAERVWEPQLPKVLAKAGVEYTVVDDTHFHAVGFADRELRGHFLTESEGLVVRVFPISQRLRYLMPTASPEEVIAFLRAAHEDAQGRDSTLVMADDGEKFGLWPGTYRRVYEQGWLDRFFALCAENASWLRTATFSQRLQESPPLGWAYLPTASYAELSEWALPEASSRELSMALRQVPPAGRRFLRGGHFRNFLTKCPEANRLYRKMLRVSARVHSLEAGGRGKKKPDLGAALDFLWRGQCNCAYWHGVFGGLYLPHLRRAVYENLLRAEREAEKLSGAKGPLVPFSVSHEDWDGDGLPETLVEAPEADWYLTLRGGGLWEWDVKSPGLNLAGVVSRRREAYHEDLRSGEGAPGAAANEGQARATAGLQRELCYDWHGRMSLLDHFLHPDTTREAFARGRYGEQGDFVLGSYKASRAELDNGQLRLGLKREGRVWFHNSALPVTVRKELLLSPRGGWSCAYELHNGGAQTATLWFGVELAFAFSAAEVCPEAEQVGVAVRTFKDEPLGVSLRLRLEAPMDLWSFPLYTVSRSEEGLERTYQGSVLLAHRRMTLAAGASERLSVTVEAQ